MYLIVMWYFMQIVLSDIPTARLSWVFTSYPHPTNTVSGAGASRLRKVIFVAENSQEKESLRKSPASK
ncbi:hypothetical protein MHYP_G00134990 [Metynnis hypsauchen]